MCTTHNYEEMVLALQEVGLEATGVANLHRGVDYTDEIMKTTLKVKGSCFEKHI